MRFKHCSVINLFNFGKGCEKLRVDCWDISSAKIHLLELIHDFSKLEHLTVIVMEVPAFFESFTDFSPLARLDAGWQPSSEILTRPPPWNGGNKSGIEGRKLEKGRFKRIHRFEVKGGAKVWNTPGMEQRSQQWGTNPLKSWKWKTTWFSVRVAAKSRS